MQYSDINTLNAVRKDKDVGMRQLFDRYYRPLVLYANEYLKNSAVAEDIVQELFIKLWEDDYLVKIKDGSLGNYLYSAVRNSCYTYNHRRDVMSAARNLDDVDIPVECVADVDEKRIDLVMNEFDKMPVRTRQALECVMLRNLKYREAAEEMGISVNTVKFLLKDGTRRLREGVASVGADILFFFAKCMKAF